MYDIIKVRIILYVHVTYLFIKLKNKSCGIEAIILYKKTCSSYVSSLQRTRKDGDTKKKTVRSASSSGLSVCPLGKIKIKTTRPGNVRTKKHVNPIRVRVRPGISNVYIIHTNDESEKIEK